MRYVTGAFLALALARGRRPGRAPPRLPASSPPWTATGSCWRTARSLSWTRGISAESLNPGASVVITYEERDGQLVATAITPSTS